MTDSEIVKALKCCGDDASKCLSCPLYSMKCAYCVKMLCNNALDLINRQRAEIEKAKSEAVREFAEKLKEHCNEISNQEWNKKTLPVSWADAYEGFIDDIDRLVEEMGCNDG